MTDRLNDNSSPATRITKLRWGGARLSDHIVFVGVGLFFWGLYDPMNGLLIISGIAVAVVGLYLRERTQFGRPGRPIVEEEFVRQADGSIKHYKFHLRLTKLEILAWAAGFFLIVAGLDRTINLFYIGSGILLVWMAQLYGNWLWFGNIGIGFSDSLSLAYEKLRKIGDGVRGEGYIVRRVAKGIQYVEGSHALTLRSGWAFVEKERIEGANGSLTTGDKLVVIIRRAPDYKRKWDAPHNRETISNEVLAQISSRTGAALNSGAVFYVHS
jgi:hypothetical protein